MRRIGVTQSQSLWKALSLLGKISCCEKCIYRPDMVPVASWCHLEPSPSLSREWPTGCVWSRSLTLFSKPHASHEERRDVCGPPHIVCSHLPDRQVGLDTSCICWFPAVEPFYGQIFSSLDLTTKDGKSCTKICSSISCHQKRIKN